MDVSAERSKVVSLEEFYCRRFIAEVTIFSRIYDSCRYGRRVLFKINWKSWIFRKPWTVMAGISRMLCSWETCLGEGVLIFFPHKQRILGTLWGRTKSGASSHWFGFVHSSLKVAKMDYFRWFKGAPNHVQDHLFALKSSSSDQRLWFTFTIGETRRKKQHRPSFQKHLLDPFGQYDSCVSGLFPHFPFITHVPSRTTNRSNGKRPCWTWPKTPAIRAPVVARVQLAHASLWHCKSKPSS